MEFLGKDLTAEGAGSAMRAVTVIRQTIRVAALPDSDGISQHQKHTIFTLYAKSIEGKGLTAFVIGVVFSQEVFKGSGGVYQNFVISSGSEGSNNVINH